MREPPNILALNTAMDSCSVAVAGGRCAALSEPMERGQAQRLVPMIGEVMASAGLEYSEIDLVVTTTGPGAFTGLRIGLSTARAIGLATGRPVAGVTTLEALAAKYFCVHASPREPLVVLVDTRREDVYAQVFSPDGEAQSGPQLLGAAGLGALTGGPAAVIGNAVARVQGMGAMPEGWRIAAGFEAVDPLILAGTGLACFRAGRAAEPPAPVYLREADVTSPKPPKRFIASDSV